MFQVQRELQFAKRLRQARLKARVQQAEIAEAMALSRQHINNWFHGYCKPKNARMRELARILKVDPKWLEHGDASQLKQEIDATMQLMRIVVRNLNHIHQALGKQ